MWLDSKAVNCPQKWGNFKVGDPIALSVGDTLDEAVQSQSPQVVSHAAWTELFG